MMKFWYHLVLIKTKTLALGIWPWLISGGDIENNFYGQFSWNKSIFLQFRLQPLAPLDSLLSIHT
jgi:hypothetical protein